MSQNLHKILPGIIFVFFMTLFLDWFLGILGMPAYLPVHHEPNIQEVRERREFRFTFSTNSRGIRYPEIKLEKPEGNRRIFVVGDGHVEGVGVSLIETFPAQLERYFNMAGKNVHFINGGLAGKGPLESVRLFDIVGSQYDVDGLLMCISANDLNDLPDSMIWKDFLPPVPKKTSGQIAAYWFYPQTTVFWQTTGKKWLEPERNLIAQVSNAARSAGIAGAEILRWQNSIPADVVESINQRMLNGRVLSRGLLRPDYWIDALDIKSREAERKWRNLAFSMKKMMRLTRYRKGKIAAVFIPSVFQYDSTAYDSANVRICTGLNVRKDWLKTESELQQRIAKWCKKFGVPLLDLTPAFRKAIQNSDSLYYPLDGRWTAQGNRVASIAIRDWLEKQAIFDFLGTAEKEAD